MSVKQRLESSGIVLPEPPEPKGLYIPFKAVNNLLYISGMLPLKDGKLMAKGRVPSEVSVQMARECAKQVVLNMFALVEKRIGLDRIKGCLRLNGFVASDNDFIEQPDIVNAASELLNSVFPDGHTRTAIGVPVLPLGSPIEIDFILILE